MCIHYILLKVITACACTYIFCKQKNYWIIMRLFLCLPLGIRVESRTAKIYEHSNNNWQVSWMQPHYMHPSIQKLRVWINSEATEQMNSVLRRIGKSTTYMNPRLFLKTLSFFVGYHNFKAISRPNK